MRTLVLLALLSGRPNWKKVEYHLYINLDSVVTKGPVKSFDYVYSGTVSNAMVDCEKWTFNNEVILPDTVADSLAATVCK